MERLENVFDFWRVLISMVAVLVTGVGLEVGMGRLDKAMARHLSLITYHLSLIVRAHCTSPATSAHH